jgi:UDP-N-acetylmuramoylalanine--D-glutamate ligase
MWRMINEYFKGKKITVMGLGLLGRGVGDVAYLAEMGAELIVTDLKTESDLSDSMEKLKGFGSIEFVLEEHREEDFVNRDYVLVAAGVPMDSPYLEVAKQNGVPLKQSAAWFAELSKIPIIGVTGTRGKSTTTHLIHHILSEVTGEQILLGGNIRGVSNLQLLKEVKEDSLAVMELDSWQLQGWGWAGISPQVAVFTSFMEDHLNYYQREGISKDEAMSAYFADKANIYRHQKESDTLITTPAVFEWIKKSGGELGQELILTDSSDLPDDLLFSMPGEHNRLNASLAVSAVKATGLSEEEIWPHLATFPGVPGRLELLGTTNEGVRIYNDNNATEPNATIAGLTALDLGNQNIILIAGGADKNVDLSSLVTSINEHCKSVILTPGSGTEKLFTIINDSEQPKVRQVGNLAEALEEAHKQANAGDIILFSPAFASFAQYKNEYERNDEFVGLVSKYLDI